MRRETLIALGLGSLAALAIIRRGSSRMLGSPLENRGSHVVTPRGFFGASRAGPPAHSHQGVDLAAPAGSRVLAIGDGVIVATGAGLGKIVRKLKLDVPSGWTFSHRLVRAVVYADLGKPLVEAGDRVRKGDPIALVDRAGFFHFAVKEGGPHGEVFFDPREAGFSYRLSTRPTIT